MAQIVLTIPDAQADNYIEFRCETGNYELNKINGETRVQFTRRMLAEQEKAAFAFWKRRKRQIDAEAVLPTDSINIS